MMIRFPGVYAPQSDTRLISDAVRAEKLDASSQVLDLCSGSGALSVCAAKAGAGTVFAVDISRRAAVCTWMNGRLRGHRIHARHGDLLAPFHGRRFDLVVSNPPYVPSVGDRAPRTGRARSWDGGNDGRLLIDRICAKAPGVLRKEGTILLIQSALSGIDRTVERLADHELEASVVSRTLIPFGPVLLSRRRYLESIGVIAPDQVTEEIVVIRARR
ncbi:HemK2/MTQ2 family protein methyltransferase [Rhodococcus sp. GB-02]|uniref:HemK2/MTQ2 family protein methyltransferase n=1 Tax=Rhodococcus erythropolis TaxID=1833 RepID=UPI001E4D66A2|nr:MULTISPECIES: HemK2/MTQ2 family protein methyltransferase [Rhodococcus erythropolis group]MCD2104654.1 methyltransferase [Rhodococcus qingshengii]MCZ4525220.1 methyltransferase [Rhodococcus erythropolis]